MHDPGPVQGPDGRDIHRVHCHECWEASVEILKSIGKTPPKPDAYWKKPTVGATIDNTPWTSKVRPYWTSRDDDEDEEDDSDGGVS
jgi:hypothetical protein